MLDIFPDARHVVRELIPRALLIAATFKWIMPWTTLFRFSGPIWAAAIFGVAFAAMFWMLGGYVAGLPAVQRFFERNSERWWLPVMHIVLMIGVPALALYLSALSAPVIFGFSAWYALPAGSVIINLACAATHTWENSGAAAPKQ